VTTPDTKPKPGPAPAPAADAFNQSKGNPAPVGSPAPADAKPADPADPADAKADAPAKVKVDVPLEQLAKVYDVPEDETVAGITNVALTPAQVRIIEAVEAARDAWAADGKPKVVLSKGKHRHRFIVAPENAEAVREGLRIAATRTGLKVMRAPAKRHPESGQVQIYWAAVDRAPRKPRTPKVDDKK
jgi:hypothetical protein